MTQSQFNADKLHRLVKLAMDTGEAATVQEAEGILNGYSLGIQINKIFMESPAYQASLLTAVNTGRRCFLGGVQVSGDLDVPLKIPWKNCSTIAEAIVDLQGEIVNELDATLPTICFADNVAKDGLSRFGVRPIIRGWSGGVIPLRDQIDYSMGEDFTPAGVLAGAIAVSEAFQFIRGDNPFAGNRSIGLSLWMSGQSNDWLNADQGPKKLESLPSKLWLIGLGHLGQAYLWTLGFLPYTMKKYPAIVLQDTDTLEDANDSTSLLTNRKMVGIKKTRAVADWCEHRGFQTTLIERKFAAGFTVNDDEPHLALCGVDNAAARADLQKVGFKRIIEAGLGKGTQGYLGFQIHIFPASRTAESYWKPKAKPDEDPNPSKVLENIIQQPAYQELQSKGLDQCGLTELAGRSVGASFVGAITSTLVIGQILRLVHGEKMDEVIDGDLRSSCILSASIPNQINLEAFNPGIIIV